MIFISYRKADAQNAVDHLARELKRHFGEECVFKDDQDIHAGEKWPDRLHQEILRRHVLLAVVGDKWLALPDEYGRRRIDDKEDWVRREVCTALEANKCVIVLLVNGAQMPTKHGLPRRCALQKLPDLQALSLRSGSDHEADMAKLIKELSRRLPKPPAPPPAGPSGDNPFVCRGGITDGTAFFGREDELRRLRTHLNNGENCQIVGPPCIGKSALLRQVRRLGTQWNRAAIVVYADLDHPGYVTQAEWLRRISEAFGWSGPIISRLDEFTDRMDQLLMSQRRPVLCLDHFEKLADLSEEFSPDFYLALRYCGQQGLSVFTTATRPLSEILRLQGGKVSPLSNSFRLISLGCLTDREVAAFLGKARPGILRLTQEEQKRIAEFAKGHPLALKVACDYALQAKERGKGLDLAIQEAEDDMRARLPMWSSDKP